MIESSKYYLCGAIKKSGSTYWIGYVNSYGIGGVVSSYEITEPTNADTSLSGLINTMVSATPTYTTLGIITSGSVTIATSTVHRKSPEGSLSADVAITVPITSG